MAYEEAIRFTATDNTGPTTDKVQQRMKTLEKGGKFPISILDKATEPLKRIQEQLMGLARTATNMILGGALFQLGEDLGKNFEHAVGSVLEVGTAVSRLMFTTGESAETVSGLVAVMERMGVESDSATTAVGRFSRGMQTVVNANAMELASTTGVIGALKNLGVSVKDIHSGSLSMNDALMKVADRFSQMPDGITKTAAVLALFGRGAGPEMVRFLNLGSKGIEEAEAAAKKYGLVLSNENIAKVREFGMAHKDFDEAVQGLTLQLGMAFLPMLTQAAAGAAKFAEEFNQSVMPTFQGIGDVIAGPTAAAFKLLSNIWGTLIGWVQGTFMPRLHDLWEMLSPTRSWIGYALLWMIQTAWPQLLRAAQLFGDWVETRLIPVLKDLSSWLDVHVSPAATFLAQNAFPALSKGVDVAAGFISDRLIPALGEAYDWLQKHPVVLAILAGLLAGFAAAWLVTLGPIGQFIGMLGKMWVALRLAGAGLGLILTPLGIALVVVGALAGAFVYLYNSSDEFRRSVDEMWRALKAGDWSAIQVELVKIKDDLLTWVQSVLVPLADALANWTLAFVAWVAPMAVPLAEALANIALQIITWTGDRTIDLANHLVPWGRAFVDWVAPAIPLVLAALDDLDARITTWIAAQVPALITQLGLWTGEFLRWIADVVARLPGELDSIVASVKTWIAGGGMKNAGAEAGNNFMAGMWDALTHGSKTLLDNFDKLLRGGLGTVGTGAEMFGTAVQAGMAVPTPTQPPGVREHLSGGWLTEPIVGTGLNTGSRYSFVENGKPEYVVPNGGGTGGGGGTQISLTVAAGAVQISGAAGPSQDWAAAADGLWNDLHARLTHALSNRPMGAGRGAW